MVGCMIPSMSDFARAAVSGCATSFGNIGELQKLSRKSLNEVLYAVELTQPGIAATERLCRLVQECINKRDLTTGRAVHSLVVGKGIDLDSSLGSHMIHMFAMCGSLLEANLVFSTLPQQSVYTWTAIISAHVKLREEEQGIKIYYQMQESSVKPNGYVFVAILKACASTAALEEGIVIHNHIIGCGFESGVYVSNTLIHMYTKCGRIDFARIVFDRMPYRDVITWNVMIAGYVQQGQSREACQLFQLMQHEGYLTKPDTVTWNTVLAGCVQCGQIQKALALYEEMQQEGLEKNKSTFVIILKACSIIEALQIGNLVHKSIIESGIKRDIMIINTLIGMYAKCGNMKDAHQVFDTLPIRTVVTWNALIAGLVQHGDVQDALQLFQKMYQQGFNPDDVTFISVLKACCSIGMLQQGKSVHVYIILLDLDSDINVSNTLIDMYAKCGCLDDAHKIFGQLPQRDVVSWNAMLTGSSVNGHGILAFTLFQEMQQRGMEPNKVTFIAALTACSNEAAVTHGNLMYAHVIESSFEQDTVIGNTLIHMYTDYGCLNDAQRVFNRLLKKDVITWTGMIAGYAEHGGGQEALLLYQQMQKNGVEPNGVTIANVLKACSTMGALDQGKAFHALIINKGFGFDLYIANSLINMYAKCGSLSNARRLFDSLSTRSVVTWNAMIAGYSQYGHAQEALQLFERMHQEGMEPDNSTWNAILSGYAKHGDSQEALQFLQQMQQAGVKPDEATFVSILKACSSLAALDQGRLIHEFIIESYGELNGSVGTALVDMYAKCGNLKDACVVFSRLYKDDVVPWNAIIRGISQHSNYRLALQYFEDMQQQGMEPDDATYVCILSACSHAGLVHNGCSYFALMRQDYSMLPALDHYNCMVDLLGRAGLMIEAEDVIHTMPLKPSIVGWSSLLGNSKSHHNVETGRRCFNHIVTLDSKYATGYTLASNIYAESSMWEDLEQVQDLREHEYAWKIPGKSFIEVDETVHNFIVGDKSHTQCCDIYVKLKNLLMQIKEEGYVPALE